MIRPHDPDMNVDGEGYGGFTNGRCATRAAEALEAWRQGDEPDESNYRDLICDLRHLCDREGEDFDEQLRMGIWCYEEESGNSVPKAPTDLLKALDDCQACLTALKRTVVMAQEWPAHANAVIDKAVEMLGKYGR